MGEETDIAEPMSSEDVVAAEDVTADEPTKKLRRRRKKHLYKSLRELIEFYMGDVNLSKDRYMSQRIQGQPFVYVDLSLFLTFNKVRALTSSIEDLAKALSTSDILQVSDDETQVCRKTPIKKKENEDDCTIYVEQLTPDMDHDMLTKMFSEYGVVDYVSMPRFTHNGKFKGFAFVEFNDPESAKKALEAFKIKGCCLSPQMAPEELMSIKNFDQNKENKAEKTMTVNETCKYTRNVNEMQSAEAHKMENTIDAPSPNSSKMAEEDSVSGKEKRKRKSSGTFEKTAKKIKIHQTKDNESFKSKQLKDESPNENNDFETKDGMKQNNDPEPQDEIQKSKVRKREKTEHLHSDSEQLNNECEDKLVKKKRKRINSVNSKTEEDEDESKPKKKKLESDMEEESEVSQSGGENEDDEETSKRKKRRKKKKVKKEKSTAITLGLKVLPKKEWKSLRNRYLNMQRDMMRSLKQHLIYSKYEKTKSAETEERPQKQRTEFSPVPGTVVKVTLEQPLTRETSANAKSEMRIHPDIRFVDVCEGSSTVYLRATTPQLAASLVQSRHWPTMEVIQGEEESEYWNKINLDREGKKKNKSNQRGRSKLLKRAERFQSKHITTFEPS